MKYIKTEDLEFLLPPNSLSKLNGGSALKLERTEAQAMATFKKYIGKRYDVEGIFSMRELNGEDIRDPFVVKLLCHLMIYSLYAALAPHEIPEHRKFDYEETMNFLREVGRGDNDSDFPLKDVSLEENTVSEIRVNSYPKIDHRY